MTIPTIRITLAIPQLAFRTGPAAPIDEEAGRYASTLPRRRAEVRQEGRGPSGFTGPADERRSGGGAGFRAAAHDRAGRADGRRQDQDRPPPGSAPQPALLRFGHRDRESGRRD